MHRPRLGLALVAVSLLLLVAAGAARAADRSDPIPVTVGPPGGAGFYVNPSAPGLDPARVQAVLRRSLERWGNPYLGLSDAIPGADDAVSVIGVTPLPDGLLGLAQVRTTLTSTAVPASTRCAQTLGEVSDTVRRVNRSLSARLRLDVVSGGAVRRRTVTRKLRVSRLELVRAPVSVRICTLAAATSSSTVAPQFDVLIKPSPQFGAWVLGPALPASPAYDFETNVLHELGHISGLAHQVDECDPSTPMPSGQRPAEYWHAVDEWRRPACTVQFPPAPPPVVSNGSDSSEPLPGAGGELAGQRILINPRVPAGYDAARFVALADRAIRRAGGAPAGLTDVAPVSGDGMTVLGFAGLRAGVLTSWATVPRQTSLAAHDVRSCRASSSVRVRLRRQVVIRRTVRRGGRRLRRDVVRTKTRAARGFRCTSTKRAARTVGVAPELDLRVTETSVAWEFGPRLPTDGTRWDLESALLQTLAGASGAAPGTACDTATPNTSAGLSPGDWWRASTEVRRTRCVSGTSNAEAPPAQTPPRSATRSAPSADGHELRAAGLPYDVQALP